MAFVVLSLTSTNARADARVLENSYRDVNYTLVDSRVLENSYRDVNYTLVDFIKKT